MAPDPTPDSNDDLLPIVEAAQAGDERAFQTLVERTERLVYKIALHKCRDRTDTEDLVQEIYLHMARSLPSLREPRAFLGWLMALAHNRGNRFCRQRQARIVGLEEARRELLARAEERPEPELGVREVVAGLPEEFRLALTWKYLDGCSYEEIGERLDQSFHQVDYLLRRAKRALREGLERQQRRTREPGAGRTWDRH